jgi:hypothetical protein
MQDDFSFGSKDKDENFHKSQRWTWPYYIKIIFHNSIGSCCNKWKGNSSWFHDENENENKISNKKQVHLIFTFCFEKFHFKLMSEIYFFFVVMHVY